MKDQYIIFIVILASIHINPNFKTETFLVHIYTRKFCNIFETCSVFRYCTTQLELLQRNHAENWFMILFYFSSLFFSERLTPLVFSTQTKLLSVNLTNNLINEIQKGAFTNMTRMVRLILTRNKISRIGDHVLSGKETKTIKTLKDQINIP